MDDLRNRVWISANEVMERWQILADDLREYLKKRYTYKVLGPWFGPWDGPPKEDDYEDEYFSSKKGKINANLWHQK